MSADNDFLNGDLNGGSLNRLSMIKEMMESTTQLMTSSAVGLISPKTVTHSHFGHQPSFSPLRVENDDMVSYDSPRHKLVSKMPSRKIDISNNQQQNGIVTLAMRQQTHRQNSFFRNSNGAGRMTQNHSPIPQGGSKNVNGLSIEDSIDFRSQVAAFNNNSTYNPQRLHRQVAKQIAETKELRNLLGNSIEQIK